MFQRTANRVATDGYAPSLILTSNEFRFIVSDELAEIGVEAGCIVLEREMRNTAPAVCLAAQIAAQTDPEALLLVLPSDHLIHDGALFHAAIQGGIEPARAGNLVAFGVAPTRAETGYGYLELSDSPASSAQPFLSFVEKPDFQHATAMLESGRYLWNAGIFLFRACDILAAFDKHAPEIAATCGRALKDGREDLGFFRPDEAAYGQNPSISLDRAIMEQEGRGIVVPLDCGWNDLGTWETLWRESPQDRQGCAVSGPAVFVDCKDSLLLATCDGPNLVGLGLDGIVAVATRDAVLVASIGQSGDIQRAVDILKAAGVAAAEESPRVHRPWGWYEVLSAGPHFKVKRIVVRPGRKLSLQSHARRAEHWVVVEGTARVTIGDSVRELNVDQECYISLGVRHRLENPGPQELHLIEVQSGGYLGEDDIVRYDDVYAR